MFLPRSGPKIKNTKEAEEGPTEKFRCKAIKKEE